MKVAQLRKPSLYIRTSMRLSAVGQACAHVCLTFLHLGWRSANTVVYHSRSVAPARLCTTGMTFDF
jgi:hypothetical protein